MKGTKVASINNLYRRGFGPPDKRFLNPDGSATSRVFALRPKDDGRLSVDVKEMTTAEQSIGDSSRFVLFEISVAAIESLSLEALHDPLTQEEVGYDNPAHALIIGMDEDSDILPGLLAKASKRIYM